MYATTGYGEVKNASIMLRNFYIIEKNGLVLLEIDFSKLKIHSTNPEVNIQNPRITANKPKMKCNNKKYSIQKEGKKDQMGQVDIKKQDGRDKPTHVNNHIKYKWTKYPPKRGECQTEYKKALDKIMLLIRNAF